MDLTTPNYHYYGHFTLHPVKPWKFSFQTSLENYSPMYRVWGQKWGLRDMEEKLVNTLQDIEPFPPGRVGGKEKTTVHIKLFFTLRKHDPPKFSSLPYVQGIPTSLTSSSKYFLLSTTTQSWAIFKVWKYLEVFKTISRTRRDCPDLALPFIM